MSAVAFPSSSAAATLLARFQAFEAQKKELIARNEELDGLTKTLVEKIRQQEAFNKELLAENTELRAQLGRAAKQGRDDNATIRRAELEQELKAQRLDDPGSDNKDLTFDMFCRRLEALGVNVSQVVDAQPGLEELHANVRDGEVQISTVGGKLLQQYKVVRVYLLAKIAGDERCLIHHDHFNLKTGIQRTLMVPLEVRMVRNENWREAARRGLRTMIGLSLEWQEMYTAFDEGSAYCYEERGSPAAAQNPLKLLTSVEVHEIHVRIVQQQITGCISSTGGAKDADAEEFERIGLPHGRDFVYCDRDQMVHVWCWKSREYERNGRMKSFEKYLAAHGVDTSQFGIGQNKTLFEFYHEAREEKHCSLHEVTEETNTGGPKLQRVVQILKIKLIAEVHKRKRMLMESEQFGLDGRKRSSGQLIIKKLREDEDWNAVVPTAIQARIGISPNLQAQCFELDYSKTTYAEEVVKSKGFAGIMTCYKIRTVTMYVTNPNSEELEVIGLPRGNDFVSRVDSKDAAGSGHKLHVWTWAPAVDEEQAQGTQFNGTALELLNRDLGDVESLLAHTVLDPQIQHLGFDKPFKQSLTKLKQCAERLADIDKTITSVDLNDVMGPEGSPASRRRSAAGVMGGLKNFIEANFVRQQVPETQREAGGLDDGVGDGFSDVGSEDDQPGIESRPSQQLPMRPFARDIMEGRDTWDFDFFTLYEKSGPNMLEIFGEAIVVPYCISALKCDRDSALAFVSEGAAQYLDNPYHGPIHAAQVCHLSRWLTKAMRIMENQSDIERAAFTIAGFCHDIKHIGRNNAFCVMTEHPLALVYSNSRVLESFHSATCLELLEDKTVLTKVSRQDRSLVRSHIIENILATDMAEHFETISKFRVRRDAHDFSSEHEPDRRFVARLCLKAGDLGHGCLPWHLHVNWCFRVTQEFYAQGDEETKLGLPISALCDRNDVDGLAKSQKGFLDFVVLPLFQALAECQNGHSPPIGKSAPEDTEEKKRSPSKSSVTPVTPTSLSVAGAPKGRRRSSIPCSSIFQIENCNISTLHSNGKRWQEDEEAVEDVKTKLKGLSVG